MIYNRRGVIIMSKKTISFRIDEEMLQKLRVIAEQEERTVGGQITVLVRKCIEWFEQKQAGAQRRSRGCRQEGVISAEE